jgi:hypothetical protein
MCAGVRLPTARKPEAQAERNTRGAWQPGILSAYASGFLNGEASGSPYPGSRRI